LLFLFINKNFLLFFNDATIHNFRHYIWILFLILQIFSQLLFNLFLLFRELIKNAFNCNHLFIILNHTSLINNAFRSICQNVFFIN
jgi:hypothetical protein